VDHEPSEAEPAQGWPPLPQQGAPVSSSRTSSDRPGKSAEVKQHNHAVAEMMEFLGLSPEPTDQPARPTCTHPPGGDSRPLEAGDGPPRSIGKYIVVEPLDEGGQGQVFRVVHPGLGKDLVLKLSRRPVAIAADERDRIVAEGRLLAGLDHPNLVRVVDLDFHRGRPFLVMDYVPGRHLELFAAQERITPGRAAAIVAELARVVGVVHRKGIVHLDIKPRNVLIDESGRPRLIDFGMARLRHAWADGPGGPTGGTLAYMAPEQARGEADRIGPAADVFALGGVLYFLLTGRPPFTGKDSREVWDRARRGDLEPEALRQAGVLRRLERICLSALEADPQKRIVSADRLALELERYSRLPRRAVLSVLAAVPLLGAGLWFGRRPRAPEPPHDGLTDDETRKLMANSLGLDLTLIVRHYRSRGDGRPPLALGEFGCDSTSARPDDLATVEARFSAPAFSRLLAFNPDGSVQLCETSDPGAGLTQATRWVYPRLDEHYFAFTDGTGLQAFVLVASRMPLVWFKEWATPEALGWSAVPAAGAWTFDGLRWAPLSRSDDDSRGQVVHAGGPPAALTEACRRLADRFGQGSVRAVAFPVD
jgi:hypothetical protein